MDSLACALLSGTVALVLVGIPLAMAGWFRPYVVLPAALLGAWVLLPLFRVDSWPSRRGLDAAVIGVIAAAALLNAAHGGAWVKGGLDPSTYFSEATWLAQEGKIPMDSHPELFGGLPTVRAGGYPYAKSYPFSPLDGTRLQPYLFRGFPVLLAPAYWLGGTRLLAAVPGLLGGLALLLFYVLSRRLLRPWIAAVMTAALAFNPAQMYFSRNPWSEIAAQVFVLGAMWLLVAGRNRFRGWLAAGLTLGLACTVRIDAQMYLAPLLAYAALFVIRGVSGADEGARARSRFALAALAGFGVGFGLALMDGVLSGPAYLRDHWGPLRLAWLSTVLVVAGIIIVFGVRRFAPGVVAAVVARRGSIVRWAVVLTVVGMGFALFIRPRVGVEWGDQASEIVAQAQSRQGLPVEATRTYGEAAALWLLWSVGLAAFMAAVGGLASRIRNGLRGRDDRWWPLLSLFCVVTAAYLWRPMVNPLQPWGMRRFVPVTLPLLVLFAGAAIDQGTRRRKRGGTVPRVLWVGVAVLCVATPLVSSIPLAGAEEMSGMRQAISRVCAALPARAVVVADEVKWSYAYLAGVQAECRVPTASVSTETTTETWDELKARARGQGRRVVSLAVLPEERPLPEGYRIVTSAVTSTVELTVVGWPRRMETSVLRFALREIR